MRPLLVLLRLIKTEDVKLLSKVVVLINLCTTSCSLLTIWFNNVFPDIVVKARRGTPLRFPQVSWCLP